MYVFVYMELYLASKGFGTITLDRIYWFSH